MLGKVHEHRLELSLIYAFPPWPSFFIKMILMNDFVSMLNGCFVLRVYSQLKSIVICRMEPFSVREPLFHELTYLFKLIMQSDSICSSISGNHCSSVDR